MPNYFEELIKTFCNNQEIPGWEGLRLMRMVGTQNPIKKI
jgi:hypothetical protein